MIEKISLECRQSEGGIGQQYENPPFPCCCLRLFSFLIQNTRERGLPYESDRHARFSRWSIVSPTVKLSLKHNTQTVLQQELNNNFPTSTPLLSFGSPRGGGGQIVRKIDSFFRFLLLPATVFHTMYMIRAAHWLSPPGLYSIILHIDTFHTNSKLTHPLTVIPESILWKSPMLSCLTSESVFIRIDIGWGDVKVGRILNWSEQIGKGWSGPGCSKQG